MTFRNRPDSGTDRWYGLLLCAALAATACDRGASPEPASGPGAPEPPAAAYPAAHTLAVVHFPDGPAALAALAGRLAGSEVSAEAAAAARTAHFKLDPTIAAAWATAGVDPAAGHTWIFDQRLKTDEVLRPLLAVKVSDGEAFARTVAAWREAHPIDKGGADPTRAGGQEDARLLPMAAPWGDRQALLVGRSVDLLRLQSTLEAVTAKQSSEGDTPEWRAAWAALPGSKPTAVIGPQAWGGVPSTPITVDADRVRWPLAAGEGFGRWLKAGGPPAQFSRWLFPGGAALRVGTHFEGLEALTTAGVARLPLEAPAKVALTGWWGAHGDTLKPLLRSALDGTFAVLSPPNPGGDRYLGTLVALSLTNTEAGAALLKGLGAVLDCRPGNPTCAPTAYPGAEGWTLGPPWHLAVVKVGNTLVIGPQVWVEGRLDAEAAPSPDEAAQALDAEGVAVGWYHHEDWLTASRGQHAPANRFPHLWQAGEAWSGAAKRTADGLDAPTISPEPNLEPALWLLAAEAAAPRWVDAATAAGADLAWRIKEAATSNPGALTIDSDPPGAAVFLNGVAPLVTGADGRSTPAVTPVTLHGVNAARAHEVRVVLAGHQPESFTVGEHQWSRGRDGQLRFRQGVSLEPEARQPNPGGLGDGLDNKMRNMGF